MGWAKAQLSLQDFKRLGSYIESLTGICMPPSRLSMLEGRLRARLRALQMSDFSDYCDHALASGGNQKELAHIIDRASTHTTEFFRESVHFDFLAREALPALRSRATGEPLSVWCAGCSTGEEAYSLAMVLSDEAARGRGMSYRILATDISQAVLRTAQRAVYAADKVSGIPKALRERYLLRSKDRDTPTVRITAELRQQATFSYLNLMDASLDLSREVDVLFCRNVFIYFDRPTQQQIVQRFARRLRPGGYLFLGHTETIQGLAVPLDQVAPAVYRAPIGRP
jgi:chemotaxis protein methyltransferase CheR